MATHHADLAALSRTESYSIFDLHDFLRTYVPQGQEKDAIARAGVCVAERLLGPDIFGLLSQHGTPRTLRIELPAASSPRDPVAAMLARVPWELASAHAGQPSLAALGLHVRIVQGEPVTAPPSRPLSADEPFRLLFVLAESHDSTPLAARQELASVEVGN